MYLWNQRKIKRGFLLLLIMLVGIGISSAQQSPPLSTGPWVRIGITKTGIYKIDWELIKRFGWNPDQIDLRTVRLYGYGGGMLPQANASSRPTGLDENAVWVEGQENGRWDATDVLYFFGEGPHIVAYDSTEKGLRHLTNTYSDSSFYFITHGGVEGKRIAWADSPTTSAIAYRDSFDDYWYQETERYNLLQSGRNWWGEYLGGSPLSIKVPMANISPNTGLRVDLSAIAAAQQTTSISLSLGGQAIGLGNFTPVPGQTYTAKGSLFEGKFSANTGGAPANDLLFTLAFDNKGQLSAQSFLNYLGVQTKRSLIAYDQQMYHFLPHNQDILGFRFLQVSLDWKLWDVTDPALPADQPFSINGSEALFEKSGNRAYRRYLGFKKEKALAPASWAIVPNQSLDIDKTTELLIVTAPAFVQEAQRLASHRRTEDGLIAEVVTTRQIFNQYASGKADPTAIRDFVRTVYQHGNLKYLLLFGDATYDYKNNFQNQTPFQQGAWVPTYESRESLLPIYTYASDDYYGFLDEEEGEWQETVAGDHLLDIGIGRLPVRSQQEATYIVDKLIHHQTSESKGSWRNRIAFVADDGDGEVHQYHATQLAGLIDADFLTQKIFLDEYPQPEQSGSQHVPQASQRIQSVIDRGALILNYTGHGGVNGWAQEQVLTLPDMLQARGYNNLPVLVTATCDFGRYDDMAQVSGGELMVLSPRGAAIAALSTTRPVYSSTNFTLNKALYQVLSQAKGLLRLGDLVRETKNNALVGSLNRNFTLLGDPSMPLVDRTRHMMWQSKPDTLTPGRRARLAGKIVTGNAELLDADFNGKAYITIFDKSRNFTTLGDEGEKIEYQDHRDKLYEGTVSVKEGIFEVDFTVPLDARADYGIGKMSAYALTDDEVLEAHGQCALVVGGKASIENSNPLAISAYMDERSFQDGDQVPASSVMVVELKGAQGVNLAGTEHGRSMTVTLNDTLEIILNDYYRADLDDFTAGSIVYPFKNLPEGSYRAMVKVYDSYNNLSKITFGFEVGASRGVAISELVIYPNPFETEWSFDLEHNRADEDIALELKVMTVSGALLGVQKWTYYNAPAKIKETVRAGPLTHGLHINQLYIYMLSIESLEDNTVARSSGRLMRSP